MIPLTNEQIEAIRKRSEELIQERFGSHLQIYIQEFKTGDYIRYLIKGYLSPEQIEECRKIITDSGTEIGKVYFDQ